MCFRRPWRNSCVILRFWPPTLVNQRWDFKASPGDQLRFGLIQLSVKVRVSHATQPHIVCHAAKLGLNQLFAAFQFITSFILNVFCMNLSEGFPAMFFEFYPSGATTDPCCHVGAWQLSGTERSTSQHWVNQKFPALKSTLQLWRNTGEYNLIKLCLKHPGV